MKINSRFISLVSIFTVLYTVLCYCFHPISFLQIQIRIADALYPFIAFYDLPALIGLVIGHFLVNLSSPLGIIDLLSVLLCLPAKITILKYGLKAVPIHVFTVTVWVSYMLYIMFGISFWLSVIMIGLGETIAEIGIGVPLVLEVRKRFRK